MGWTTIFRRVFIYNKGVVMDENNNGIGAIRHSLAHLLAYSVKQLYPGSHNAIGPAIENGFYQDFEMSGTISQEDLPKIETKMKEALTVWRGFERKEVTLDEALEIFADNKYKQELAREFAEGGKTLTVYTSGDFVDLCKGGHVENIATIDPEGFKLTKTAGAYWRGDEKNIMLTRIYGVAFATKEELENYLQMQEEAKKRDHRRLGKELDLFIFSDLVGSGLPLYMPNGTVVRNGLIEYSEKVRELVGFQKVWSPHITKKELYEASGHWNKFGDQLLLVKSQETSDELVMKPMNCPHHAQIYAARPRSYRDLPLKLMETATNYRDEKSGEMHGLSRVRSLTQDDSHTYCRPEQVDEVFDQLIEKVQDFYRTIDMSLSLRLSLRDKSDAFLGPQNLWDFGQNKLAEIAKRNKLDYYAEEGEAAFYGPKLDFMAEDAIGRKWQLATIQFDFVQPERFALEYTDQEGEKKRPIMIHCAIMGSVDRFFSVYIEHTAGKFPVWLAPEQLRIIQVKDSKQLDGFVEKIAAIAHENGIRTTVDHSNESVGKKIRAAEMMKIPYTVVVGEKELESGRLSPRIRADLVVGGSIEASYPFENFIVTIANEARARAQKSSL
jgi:threonyl-tRNA synthetase